MKFGPDIELIYWDIGSQWQKKIGQLREKIDVLNDVIINQMTFKWHMMTWMGMKLYQWYFSFIFVLFC